MTSFIVVAGAVIGILVGLTQLTDWATNVYRERRGRPAPRVTEQRPDPLATTITTLPVMPAQAPVYRGQARAVPAPPPQPAFPMTLPPQPQPLAPRKRWWRRILNWVVAVYMALILVAILSDTFESDRQFIAANGPYDSGYSPGDSATSGLIVILINSAWAGILFVRRLMRRRKRPATLGPEPGLILYGILAGLSILSTAGYVITRHALL